jgi:hypothetical protein
MRAHRADQLRATAVTQTSVTLVALLPAGATWWNELSGTVDRGLPRRVSEKCAIRTGPCDESNTTEPVHRGRSPSR